MKLNWREVLGDQPAAPLFIEIEGTEGLEDKGGYAKEVSEDFKRKQQAVLRKHVSAADVVITTLQSV